jgi:hypothetical protein
MSSFPARISYGHDHTYNASFTPGTSGDAFIPGEFVAYDTSADTMKRCGADPTAIAGIAEVTSGDASVITPNGKVPIRILTGGGVVLALSSTTVPTEAMVGDSYGITRSAAGFWRVDTSKTTTSSRVRVVAVDIPTETFFCVVHANLLQFSNLVVATS